MNAEEYKKGIQYIVTEANSKKRELAVEFALSNNNVKKGDVVEDHIGRIEVEKISVKESFLGLPGCTYYGVELTKKGIPNKKGTKRWVYQSNLKKITI